MQIRIVISALIIGRRTFAFIRGTRSSDRNYYLVCNKCEVHLSEEDTDKSNGL